MDMTDLDLMTDMVANDCMDNDLQPIQQVKQGCQVSVNSLKAQVSLGFFDRVLYHVYSRDRRRSPWPWGPLQTNCM